MVELVLDRVENAVENGENPSYEYFLLFPPYFQKAFFPELFGKG